MTLMGMDGKKIGERRWGFGGRNKLSAVSLQSKNANELAWSWKKL